MRRRHYHYTEWEDFHAGMYEPSDQIAEHTARSVDLLRDPVGLRRAMEEVVDAWPVSASQNLTDTGSNRRSWLGQAACCREHGSPEVTTCQAWWQLSTAEQAAANAVADDVIRTWEAGVNSAQASFGI